MRTIIYFKWHILLVTKTMNHLLPKMLESDEVILLVWTALNIPVGLVLRILYVYL